MLRSSLAATVGFLMAGIGALLGVTRAEASGLQLVGDSTVEEEALTFAEGPATRFGLTANCRTHQQTPLTTYRGYQYVTYFDAERRVCLGRRKLPNGAWEVIAFEDHRFETNDSHNAAVLGVCDRDGTIHMAFDHHASPLNYRVSKVGVAHRPDTTPWTADLFGGVQHALGEVETDESVTYPRFFSAPNGNLMLYYRAVTSGNGDGMIEEYDGEQHRWTPGLGKFIARDLGEYSARGKTSPYRCPYMNSLSYAGGRLHASWVWRDRFEKTDPRNQHDLCYAYSDDHGRTWRNSAGRAIGRTGEAFIHLDTPGLVVAPILPRARVANQNTHYAYPDGSLHVVLRHRVERSRENRYQHYWRSAAGEWRHEELPFSGNRPKLVGAEDRSLVLVYTDDDELRLAKGVPIGNQERWRWTPLRTPRALSNYADAVLDLERWEAEKVLSIYSQSEPAETIRTDRTQPVDGVPSPLKVIDFRLPGIGTPSE